MNTPKWIEDKAEQHFYQNNNRGIYNTGSIKDAHIATYTTGAMEVYQEMEKLKGTDNQIVLKLVEKVKQWKEVAGDMYNWFKDAYGQEISTARTGELIAKYEKLRDNANN